MQNCTDCGRPLPPGAFACPNCGKRVTSQNSSGVDETILSSYSPAPAPPVYNPPSNNPLAAPPPSSSPYFGTPSAPQPPYFPATPPAPYPAGNPNAPVPPGMFGAQGTPGAPGGYSSPSYPAPPPGSPYHASGQYGPYTPGAFGAAAAPPPKRKRGFSVLTLVLLGALALLFLSGGIGIIVYTTSIRPAQINTEKTSTAQVTGTKSAQSTATVNTQVTGTAVAVESSTASAQAQATAQVVATETALNDIYTKATSGNPAYTGTLAGQDGAGWQVFDSTGGGGCFFSGGALHSSIPTAKFYVPCFATAKTFDNFALEVEMTILKGDEGGIIFRGTGVEGRNSYFFSADTKGLYFIDVSTGTTANDYKSLVYDDTPLLKKNPGQTNLITIIARGDTISLYINKKYVASVKDGTYKSGLIAFFAASRQVDTEATFKNVKVWQL